MYRQQGKVLFVESFFALRARRRAVAEHARDIYEADFNFPIILSPSGVVLDGMHRLSKAFLLGMEEINAVQLPAMPPYRWRLLPNGEEVEFTDKAFEQS